MSPARKLAVVQCAEEADSVMAAAKKFNVTPASVYRWRGQKAKIVEALRQGQIGCQGQVGLAKSVTQTFNSGRERSWPA